MSAHRWAARPRRADARAPAAPAARTAPARAGLPRYLAAGTPQRRLQPPGGGRDVEVHDTPAGQAEAARMGAYAFAWQDRIFLGPDPGIPGGPSRDEVLHHEMVHVLQGRQRGPVADDAALERQARGWHGGPLLSADPAQAHPLLWVPFVIGMGYILFKPNTANAPGPNSPTYKSMDTADYGKMVAEAALLASGGLVASSLRNAGYSVVTTWGVSGAYGSMGYRGVQDIFRGEFSGIDAYVVDGLTGATIGVIAGGSFHALGKLPGLARGRDWFLRGAENDAAFARMSMADKLRYEIGQKTLASADDFAAVAELTPVERGAQFVQQHGWLRAMFPSSGKFLPGTGGTFGTGPTPGARWLFRATGGFTAGAAGNHLFGDTVHDAYGLGPGGLWSGPAADDAAADPFGLGLGPDAGSGIPTIIVVPKEHEMEYLMRSGRLGDFPVPDGTPGLRDPHGGGPPHPFAAGGDGMG